MNSGTPFLLHEATLTLYLAAANGEQLTSARPVFLGALANGLTFEESLDQRRFFSTGDVRPRVQQMDEGHAIEIERLWLVQKASGEAFHLVRNQRYVLEIVFAERRNLPPAFWHWYRRVYYGVTIGRLRTKSIGPLSFIQTQNIEAEHYLQTGGAGAVGVSSPSVPGQAQPIQFTRELSLVEGEYLSGAYQWDTDAVGVSAVVHATGPTSTSVILTLEVAGVLSERTLTLTPGEEVDDDVDLSDLEIPAGALLRWKITQAPIPEESALHASVVMTVIVEE